MYAKLKAIKILHMHVERMVLPCLEFHYLNLTFEFSSKITVAQFYFFYCCEKCPDNSIKHGRKHKKRFDKS